MIIIYPMLISPNVPTHIIPGLCKTMEKYTILYNLDDILKQANLHATASNVVSTVGKGITTAGAFSGNIPTQVAGAATSALGNMLRVTKQGKLYTEAESIRIKIPMDKQVAMTPEKEKEKQKQDALKDLSKEKSHTQAKVELPKFETISLEPTWLQVTTQQKGMQILGVKVIPFKIDSQGQILDLVTVDSSLKMFSFLMTKYGRKLTRVFYRLIRRFKDKTLTGDPRKDILFASSEYKENVFICLSQLDLQDSDVLTKYKAINKLFKLGWASFIITDDVNKVTNFCMKEFKGLCSVIPHNYMFASFGKGYEKVYEDIEDVKRSASPFFSRKIKHIKKLFGETFEENTVVKDYLNKIQE